MITWSRNAAALLLAAAFCLPAFAGGSGLNVAVVVNQNSTNSVQLGNYYCEQRGVPPQNLIRINWAGGNVAWTRTEFETLLRSSLTNALNARLLTNQIDYVVLCMDIPYRTTETTGSSATSGINSTTSALFYGFKLDGCTSCPANLPSCNLPPDSDSDYAGSEGIFRQTPPVSAVSNSWMVMMLTSSNLAQAKAIVDRGVISDYAFPTQTVILGKSQDINRNVRYTLFDNTILDSSVLGVMDVIRTNVNTSYNFGTMLGYENGYQSFTVYGGFAPGAMADSLTSYGGDLFGSPDHTRVLNFLNAGATASYGTVVEPCNYLAKFPSTLNFFYQSRGFSIAECYYQSVTNPYQGILVGEPLAAPFALPCFGGWSNAPGGAILSGMTNLSLGFSASDVKRPIQQVDLFVDGLRAQTITNMPPRTNNILYVTINGFPTNYTIPANSSLQTIASNLTRRLNANSYSNATKVVAIAHGDRIELQGLNLAAGSSMPLVTSNHIGSAAVLATKIFASRASFLDSATHGLRGFTVTNVVSANGYLVMTVTKTNGSIVTVGVTNTGTQNTGALVGSLVEAINTNASLMMPDGVMTEDFYDYNFWYASQIHAGEFNLVARSPGWRVAQIQASLIVSSPLTRSPTGTQKLDENITDLRPRNHLYITAGLTNLNLTFPFNSTNHADGYHELTAVAYEGSHVRTQKRISRSVRIANNGWFATLTCLMGDTNTALESTLQFSVTQTTNNITKIELFSTGGSLGSSNGVNSANFSIPASYLGIGRHPFYAVVTRSGGKQYRTETKWIRIIGAESPFNVSVLNPAPTLAWPSTAGRSYQILSATNIADSFTLRAGITPTNSSAIWSETNSSSEQRFYRVKTP